MDSRMQDSTVISAERLREKLFEAGYVADDEVGSLVWLALALERPILIEGEAGVGKTAIGAACANALARPLLRLQCYEGLDLSQAVYEWNYGRQLLEIRLAEAGDCRHGGPAEQSLFGEVPVGAAFVAGDPLSEGLRAAH